MTMTALLEVPFHGDTITCIETPDAVFVAISPICRRLDLNEQAQRRRIQRANGLYGEAMMASPSGRGEQETLCIPINRVAMFLATIETKRVKSELRPALELYQREAADVLDRHFRQRDTEEVALLRSEIALKDQQLRACHANLDRLPKWPTIRAMERKSALSRRQIARSLHLSQDFLRDEVWSQEECGYLPLKGLDDADARTVLGEVRVLRAKERARAQAEAEREAQEAARAARQPSLPLEG